MTWSKRFITPQQTVPLALQALGSAIKFEPVMGSIWQVTTAAVMTDGQVRFTPIYVSNPTLLTGIAFGQAIQGVFTEDNNNKIGLYKWDGAGTINLVASCANDANLWKNANNTFFKKAFSSTYQADVGLYYAASLYNTSAPSTAPQLGIFATTPATYINSLDYTTNYKLAMFVNSQTDLAASYAMSALTASPQPFYMAAY